MNLVFTLSFTLLHISQKQLHCFAGVHEVVNFAGRKVKKIKLSGGGGGGGGGVKQQI